MNFNATKIGGVYKISPLPFIDERGMFMRTFCKEEFKEINVTKEFVQINHSLTLRRGTIRGLHFQTLPRSEGKLIRCIRGKVFDVAVDLRTDSLTYLQWIGIELSADNYEMIFIPEGCAHGFQTLENNSELIYHHTEMYLPEYERTVNFFDQEINISWPLELTEISEKDKNAPTFKNLTRFNFK